MWLPDDPERYVTGWKYIELARYVPNANKVVREMVGPNVPVLVEWGDVEEYRKAHKNTGVYTSVFRYNDRDLARASRLGSLYFDLDSDSDSETAYRDVNILVEHILQFVPESSLVVYFTGKKGFHVECEAICLGITPSNNLPSIYRFIARDLEHRLALQSIDFAVYDARRIWRLPNSIHQSTGLYKRRLELSDLHGGLARIRQLAQEPAGYEVAPQEFNLTANEWFRNYIYKAEQERQRSEFTPQQLLEHFNKRGSGIYRADRPLEFTPIKLEQHCHSIVQLEEKARTKHHLEHEERLFLCSILTYTEDAIEYLHKILSQCSDYNFEKSQSHIDDWLRRRDLGIGGRPFTCARANEAGVGCEDCSLERKRKWVKVGDGWVETGEDSDPSPIRFAYQPRKDY